MDGESWRRAKGNAQEKLVCQDSAAASSDPPAALPGHMQPPLSPSVKAEPHFDVKMEHMLIPFSISSLLLKIERRRCTFLPKLTAISSGSANRFSWKTHLIAAGEKLKVFSHNLWLRVPAGYSAFKAHLLQNWFFTVSLTLRGCWYFSFTQCLHGSFQSQTMSQRTLNTWFQNANDSAHFSQNYSKIH